MLNIRNRPIVQSCDGIQLKKTYGKYVSRKENTEADYYIPQIEDRFYTWAYVKIDPVKYEIRAKNVRTEERVKT